MPLFAPVMMATRPSCEGMLWHIQRPFDISPPETKHVEFKHSDIFYLGVSIDVLTAFVNTVVMSDEKERRTLEAAHEVFSRYGYARATMGDIAKAAGMSRPALYLVFPNKDDIFAAVVGRYSAGALETIRKGVSTRATLREQLLYAFTVWVIESYRLVTASPDAQDLVEGKHKAVDAATEQFERFLTELLEPTVSDAIPPTTSESVARLLVASSRGLKQAATDIEDLETMIDQLVALTVAALVGEATG